LELKNPKKTSAPNHPTMQSYGSGAPNFLLRATITLELIKAKTGTDCVKDSSVKPAREGRPRYRRNILRLNKMQIHWPVRDTPK
jgi:hypothetical protein